jgi:hypothetical protein
MPTEPMIHSMLSSQFLGTELDKFQHGLGRQLAGTTRTTGGTERRLFCQDRFDCSSQLSLCDLLQQTYGVEASGVAEQTTHGSPASARSTFSAAHQVCGGWGQPLSVPASSAMGPPCEPTAHAIDRAEHNSTNVIALTKCFTDFPLSWFDLPHTRNSIACLLRCRTRTAWFWVLV